MAKFQASWGVLDDETTPKDVQELAVTVRAGDKVRATWNSPRDGEVTREGETIEIRGAIGFIHQLAPFLQEVWAVNEEYDGETAFGLGLTKLEILERAE